jgi:hypothetical protein
MLKSAPAIPSIMTICLALAACGDGDSPAATHDAAVEHQHGDDDLDHHGCTHIKEGPFVDVTAGATQAAAVEVKADHNAYRVALAAGQPGYARYAAATPGDHVFFLDANLAFAVEDDRGTPVAIEESLTSVAESPTSVAESPTSVAACSEVKARHTVHLPAVGTYYLRLGPSDGVARVSMVIEALAHDHAHD